MEETVEQKNSYLVAQGVAVGGGLAGGSFERDGKVACLRVGDLCRRGKAQDVGGFIFAAEGFVEAA